MTENLRTPGQADQIIVLEHPAMGLKIPTRDEWEDEALVPQTDQLHQVAGLCVGGFCVLAGLCVGGFCVPEHKAILPHPYQPALQRGSGAHPSALVIIVGVGQMLASAC